MNASKELVLPVFLAVNVMTITQVKTYLIFTDQMLHIKNWLVIIKLKQTTIVPVVIWMASNYLEIPMHSANNFVMTTQCAKVGLFQYIHKWVFHRRIRWS